MDNILYALKLTAALFLWIIFTKILMSIAAGIGQKLYEFIMCLWRMAVKK